MACFTGDKFKNGSNLTAAPSISLLGSRRPTDDPTSGMLDRDNRNDFRGGKSRVPKTFQHFSLIDLARSGECCGLESRLLRNNGAHENERYIRAAGTSSRDA